MNVPWQLNIFKKSLKKKEKVKNIIDFMEETEGKKCLEIGCEKGITSYFLRKRGGLWLSTDIDEDNVYTTKGLVKNNVLYFKEDALPFKGKAFDCIIAIDTLEHIKDDESFLHDLYRILSDKGTLYITVPCSKRTLTLNKVARKMGLSLEYYGHLREGYTIDELTEKLNKACLDVTRTKSFIRFFTEGVELLMNYAYTFLLNKGVKKTGIKGSIAPAKEQDLNTHSLPFKIYSIIYPILWLVTRLDWLIFFASGYIIIVEAKKRIKQ